MYRLTALLLPLMLALTLNGCGNSAQGNEGTKGAQKGEPTAMAVNGVEVETDEISVPIVANGSLTPSRQTDIGPSVDGIIEKVFVHVGARVKKGEALFKTRDVDIRLQVRELESQVALAKAQLENARNEMRRQNSLKSGGWVSQSRMDSSRTNESVAEAQLGVWEARLAQARQQLSDTIVRAPYTGVISRKDVYEGRFMATRFGGMGGPNGGNSGVVQIMGIDPLAVIVVTPAVNFAKVKVGMTGKIFVDGIKEPFEAKIAVVNYGIDYKARSVEVRFSLPNPDYKILPGLFCRVELLPEPRKAIVASRKAILGTEGARYAFVEKDGRAMKISISAREIDGERMEILNNVPPGTKLLTGPNIQQLSDGMAIKLLGDLPGAAPDHKKVTL